jgi:hypothetical protein
LTIELSEEKGDVCLYCDELTLKLQKAKLGILSYEKVIKLLQEEFRNKDLGTHT